MDVHGGWCPNHRGAECLTNHSSRRLRRGLTQALDGTVKKLHLLALSCFALAVVFYLTAWPQGAVGLMAIGVFFEGIAWAALIHASRVESYSDGGPTQLAQTTDQPTIPVAPTDDL